MRRNLQRSANKNAPEENVSRRTVQVILNQRLGFCFYPKRKVQGLTKSQRIKMMQIYEKLMRWHSKKSIKRMIVSDEKTFYFEQSFNTKNGVVYSTTFEDIHENFQTVKRFQNKSSLMNLRAVSSN